MKSMKYALLVLAVGVSFQAQADQKELMGEFDSLGGNDVLYEKAKALNPDATISVVQDRIVSRRGRIEFAPEVQMVLGGDAYNKTNMAGLNVQYHFTPRWSLGAKYGYAMNQLSKEGEYLIQDLGSTGKAQIPDIDHPKSEMLAILNWYPIYGKMNLLDKGVAHFDVYLLGGAGQIELRSGNKSVYTAGGGLGIWWSQHFTTRAELRYETYKAKRYNGEEAMNITAAGLSMGYLL